MVNRGGGIVVRGSIAKGLSLSGTYRHQLSWELGGRFLGSLRRCFLGVGRQWACKPHTRRSISHATSTKTRSTRKQRNARRRNRTDAMNWLSDTPQHKKRRRSSPDRPSRHVDDKPMTQSVRKTLQPQILTAASVRRTSVQGPFDNSYRLE